MYRAQRTVPIMLTGLYSVAGTLPERAGLYLSKVYECYIFTAHWTR